MEAENRVEYWVRHANKVEVWVREGKRRTVEFDSPAEAYHFWLSLPRGTFARLYQNGKFTAQGNGLESK